MSHYLRWCLLAALSASLLMGPVVFASNDTALLTSGCAGTGSMGGCTASSLSGEGVEGGGSASFDLGYPVDIPAPIAKNVDGVDATSVEFHAFGAGNDISVSPSLNLDSGTAIGTITGGLISANRCSSKTVGLVIDGAFSDAANVNADCTFQFTARYAYVGKPLALVVFGENSNINNGGDVSYPVVITIELPTDSPFFNNQYVLVVSSTNTSSTTTDTTTGAVIQSKKITLAADDTIYFSAYNSDNDPIIGFIPVTGGANEIYIETTDILSGLSIDANDYLNGIENTDGSLCQISSSPALLCDLTPTSLVAGNVSVHPSKAYLAATDYVSRNGGIRIYSSTNALNELGYITAQNGEAAISSLTHDWLNATQILVSKKYEDDTYALMLYDVSQILGEEETSVSEPLWSYSSDDFIGQPVADWGVENSFYYPCLNSDDNITICRDTSAAISGIGTNKLILNVSSDFTISNLAYSTDHATYIAFQASSTADSLADDAIGIYDIANDSISFYTFGFNPQASSDISLLALLHLDSTNAIQVGVLNLGSLDQRTVALAAASDSSQVAINRNRTISAAGGVPPYTFSITSGSGSIDADTGIYTAPTTTGSVTIRATDAGGDIDSVDLTIVDSGSVDTSFAISGYYLSEINSDVTHFDRVEGLSIDAQDRIYMGGNTWNNTDAEYNLFVSRLDSDGNIDTSFGGGDGVTTVSNASYGLESYSIVRDLNGNIYLGGLADDGVDEAMLIAKFDSSGTLVSSFGTSGLMVNDLSGGDDRINDMLIDDEGNLIAGGATNGNFKVMSYSTSGTLVLTYDSVDFGSTDEVQAIAQQSDGKIVAVGYSGVATRTIAMARWNTDGSLDTTFGTSGKVTADIGDASDEGYAIGIQSDGTIVVGGLTTQGADVNFILLRYDTDGDLDTSFSSDGILSVAVGDSNNAAISDLVFDADENILAVGSAYNGSDFDYGLIVVDSTGELITDFDTDGKLTSSIGSNHDVPNCMALQSDGRLILGGYSVVGTNNELSVTRIWP